MKKGLVLIGLLFVLALVLSACGGNGNDTAGSDAAATGEIKEFTINATNFEFDQKEIKVNKGDTVKITLINEEGMHAVEFEGYKKEVQAGKTISFVADKTGEFEYICSIFCGAGHDDMKGTLIVQ
jgi:cytochrome c oxidase subunit 2